MTNDGRVTGRTLAGLVLLAAVTAAVHAEGPARVLPVMTPVAAHAAAPSAVAAISFRNQVIPVLTKMGCNSGACHGALAGKGRVDEALVQRFLAHPYFARHPPKSLDRDAFAAFVPEGLSLEDGAATLTAMTAAAIALSAKHVPAPPRRCLVAGGGRHNPTLMAMLARRLAVPVAPVEAVGWEGDALEGQAFAYLALRAKKHLPLTMPGTTGVKRPQSGGRFFPRPA